MGAGPGELRLQLRSKCPMHAATGTVSPGQALARQNAEPHAQAGWLKWQSGALRGSPSAKQP